MTSHISGNHHVVAVDDALKKIRRRRRLSRRARSRLVGLRLNTPPVSLYGVWFATLSEIAAHVRARHEAGEPVRVEQFPYYDGPQV